MTGVRAAVLAVAASIALLTAGCSEPTPGLGDAPNLISPTVAGPPVAPVDPMAPARPTSLRIDAIGASSSLVPLGLNGDRTIQVPPVSDPMQAGWYRLGPTPGSRGPAVILGHVNGGGRDGIFARLHELKPGDQVRVGRTDGSTAVFTITKLEQVPKTAFPSRAVYGDTPDAELRLITCGGRFDAARGSYLDNIVAFGTLTSAA
jgi:hypothetical protein